MQENKKVKLCNRKRIFFLSVIIGKVFEIFVAILGSFFMLILLCLSNLKVASYGGVSQPTSGP